MANIFISYNRKSEALVKSLAGDIEKIGHTVWFDKELSGGQAWWDQILARILDCDVFVFGLARESLNSTACNREWGYASDLGKPILPILIAGDVSTNLLAPELSKIQFVDYRESDRDSAFRLARAFTSVPHPEPRPDPLPLPPEAPISYLGSLTEQIDSKSSLSFEKQSALLMELKTSFRNPESTDDARELLQKLRKRRDLFATIAEEIDETLAISRKAPPVAPAPPDTRNAKKILVKSPTETGKALTKTESSPLPTTQPDPNETSPRKTSPKRLMCAIIGALLGTMAGIAAMSTVDQTGVWSYGLLASVGGAIAGAISGLNRRRIIADILGAGVLWIIFAMLFPDRYLIAFAAVLVAPLGAILSALLGVLFIKQNK